MMHAYRHPLFTLMLLFITHQQLSAQRIVKSPEDSVRSFTIKQIHTTALTQSHVYSMLEALCYKVGHRLSGSPQAEKAVQLTKSMMDTLGLDSTWLQPCMVPVWKRGVKERVRIITPAVTELSALALGYSSGTGGGELRGEVIEVQSLDQVDSLGEKVRGKIVFFNRPMKKEFIRTFQAYGDAVNQRVFGPARAAKFGAIAALVRSMTTELDDWPHTGVTIFEEQINPIPALAISTAAAEKLHIALTKSAVKVGITASCTTEKDAPSYNVIGEIKGTIYPEEVIVIGGHLDSWDVGHGAHDDGTGSIQSIGVLEILKRMKYAPQRTIRCVLFMNEENGGRGGKAYAEYAKNSGEKHRAAIESDAGGFSPRGFGCDVETPDLQKKLDAFLANELYLEPYNLFIKEGGGGADIGPLKQLGTLCFGLEPDAQRYFDFHHTNRDLFENVHKRELEMGTAAMASLVYLLDQHAF